MESDLWDTLFCMFFTSLVGIDFISFRYTACGWSLEISCSWSKAWYYVAEANVRGSGDLTLQFKSCVFVCYVLPFLHVIINVAPQVDEKIGDTLFKTCWVLNLRSVTYLNGLHYPTIRCNAVAIDTIVCS
jgi:hypothetical protein